jgi:hypothetical protein
MGRQRRFKLAKRATSTVMTGVAWYRRNQWARLREVAVDADVLEETYDQWHALAEKAMSDMRAHGIDAHPVDIDVEELLLWCRAEARQLDQSARAAFASIKMAEQRDGSKKPVLPTRATEPNG